MAVRPKQNFPDFFYSNEALPTTVTPLNLKNGTYFMLSVNDGNNVEPTPSFYLPPYEDNDDGMIDCLEVEDTYEIVQTKSGKFMTSFYVPGALQSIIIGTKGRKLRMLEEQTMTKIKVPRINEKGDVKITGNNERSVASARNQVAMIVLNRREKMPTTHFLSIPVLSEEVVKNFDKFKQEILDDKPTRGISDLIFQNPKRLHLTLTMLTLLDETEIQEAINVMKMVQQEIFPRLFAHEKYVTIQGVEIMNDDPSEAHVLYGKVQSQKLQQLADEIVHCFYKKGLIKKEYDKVKLHVTLMNSFFNKESPTRISFDATEVLKKYQDFYFGKILFETVELSIRHTTSPTGFYESAFSISVV